MAEMYRAARSGNLEEITRLLGSGVPTDVGNATGWRALHFAAFSGRVDILQALLQGRANPNIRDEREWSPLHIAAQQNHPEVIRLLKQHGASMDRRTNNGNTALHVAVQLGREEAAAALLECGASTALRNFGGQEPLAMACGKGQAAAVKLLLDHGADVMATDEQGSTAIHCVADGWRPELQHTLEPKLAETAVLLVVAGADPDEPNSSGKSAEALAAERGWGLAFQAAVAEGRRIAGPKPEELAKALRKAALEGNTEQAAQLLHQLSGCPDLERLLDLAGPDGQNALHNAAANGHAEILTLLLDAGASLEAMSALGDTSLHLAVKTGRVGAIRILVSRLDSSKDLRDAAGNSALHVAAARGQVAAVQQLLEGGVDPNALDAEGASAMHIAAAGGRVGVLAALLLGGASVNALDGSGATPLMLAAHRGNLAAVKSLLKAQAFTPIRDTAGNTALHHTALGWQQRSSEAYEAIVKELAMAGCEVDALNVDRDTAAALAGRRGAFSLRSLLTNESGALNIDTLRHSVRPPGIQNFWGQALKNHPYLAPRINDNDAELLTHLSELEYEFVPADKSAEKEGGHRFYFKFTRNAFFRNKRLAKQYPLKEDPQGIKATPIDWHPGKSLFADGSTGTRRPAVVLNPEDSFFDWFRGLQVPTEGELDIAAQWAVKEDCAIAKALTDVLQRPQDWYSGAAAEDWHMEEEQQEGNFFDFQAEVPIAQLLGFIKKSSKRTTPAEIALADGNAAMDEGKLGTAVKKFSDAIEWDEEPYNVKTEALFARSAAYLKMHKSKNAQEDALQFVQLREKEARGHVVLGLAWMATEDYKWAKKCFKRAVEIDPDYPDIHDLLHSAREAIKERWDRRLETVKLCVGPIIGLAMTALGV